MCSGSFLYQSFHYLTMLDGFNEFLRLSSEHRMTFDLTVLCMISFWKLEWCRHPPLPPPLFYEWNYVDCRLSYPLLYLKQTGEIMVSMMRGHCKWIVVPGPQACHWHHTNWLLPRTSFHLFPSYLHSFVVKKNWFIYLILLKYHLATKLNIS